MSGLFLSYPGGWWMFAAVAAVAVFYLFYRRFRPQAVTGLFLWGIPQREGAGGRKLEKPLVGRSLLLDFLAASLLALAFCRPGYRADSGLPVVLIMDDSFAMRARDAHVDAARTGTKLLRDATGRGREITVLFAGDRSRVERGMGLATASEAGQALADYLPTGEKGDLQGALALTQSLYGTEIEVEMITNREGGVLSPGGVGMRLHVLPGRGGNLAINRVWRGPAGAGHRERVILSIVNHDDAPTEAVLTLATLSAPDQPIHEERLTLAPRETRLPEITATLVGDATLLARVVAEAGRDVIADDSVAVIPPSPERTPTYMVEGLSASAERFCTLALEAAGCLPAPWESENTPPPDILVTSDDVAKGGVVTLEIPEIGDPGAYAPPFVVDVASPLCRDVNLASVPWVAAKRQPPTDVSEVFIAAGDTPLYWRSSSGRLHLNLALEGSLLVNEPAWPVMMANLAAVAAARLPGLGKSIYQPGEALRLNLDPVPGQPAIVSDDGGVVARGRGLAAPRNPGRYRVRLDGREVGELAVVPGFGSASDATGLAREGKVTFLGDGGTGEGRGALDLTWLALGFGVLCLLANWRREVTLARGNAGSEVENGLEEGF